MTNTKPAVTMSDKPILPAPDQSGWYSKALAYWNKIPSPARKAIVALVLTGVGALLHWLGVDPKVIETVKEVPVPVEIAPLASNEPVNYEGCRFHGNQPEHLLERDAVRWPTDRITYSIDFASAKSLNPPLSDDAIRSAFRMGLGWWTEDMDIEFVEVPKGEQALIPCSFQRIDGLQGTLAYAYLPDGSMTPRPLVIDNSERWTAGLPAPNMVSLPTVLCHEIGHSMGLPHAAENAKAVMRPFYGSDIPREQPTDVMAMTGLGYRRRQAPPASPGDVLSFPVEAKISDVEKALDKIGRKVVPK